MSPFSISTTIKTYPTQWPYETIKNDILGKRYQLSLLFTGPTRAQKLNVQYRQKTYTPNVLSFPLDTTTGEIVICPAVANPEAGQYNLSKPGYIAFLFIHGLLHLKGHDHHTEAEETQMARLEQKYVRKYGIS